MEKIVTYKENPNLKLKTVVTKSGVTEYRNNCKYINKEYYIKNLECIEIGDKWYSVESEHITFDHSFKRYALVTHCKYYGIVDLIDDDKPVFGYFSRQNPYYSLIKPDAVCYYDGDHHSCIDYRMLENSTFYVQDAHGNYLYIKDYTPVQIERSLKIRVSNQFNHLRQGYNIEDNENEYYTRKINHSQFKHELSKDVLKYSKLLGNLTFGCEFETSDGFVPTYKLNQLGLVPCRDGSVGGAEYVTIPLKGAKGVQTLKNICTTLSKHTNIDINCSYHVHIGNIPMDRSFIVSLYTLFYKTQDEFFTMFPYYKTDPTGIKRKNYCQKLKKLSIYPLKDFTKKGYHNYVDQVYKKIFHLLSEGVHASKDCNRKQLQHPIRNKWDRLKSRYFSLNLANMLFSPRGTAEFRLAPPTTNSTKAITYLFMYAAFIKYAELNKKKIFTTKDTIPLTEVFNIYKTLHPNNIYAQNLSEYLIEFFKFQQNKFN